MIWNINDVEEDVILRPIIVCISSFGGMSVAWGNSIGHRPQIICGQ